MSLLIAFLTFILVVNCLLLILLVLVQLPKKEAGAGLAFGAGAVDTLIGAGSGNALTKITKYGAGSFICLTIILAVLNAQRSQSTSRNLDKALSQKSGAMPVAPIVAPAPPSTGLLTNSSVTPVTNEPALPATTVTNSVLNLQLQPSTVVTPPQ